MGRGLSKQASTVAMTPIKGSGAVKEMAATLTEITPASTNMLTIQRQIPGPTPRSDSRSSARTKKSEKPAKDSPGYEEDKRQCQKAEAAAWQERRLQAQALALFLEERELQKKASWPILSRLRCQRWRSQLLIPSRTWKITLPPLPKKAKAKSGLSIRNWIWWREDFGCYAQALGSGTWSCIESRQ